MLCNVCDRESLKQSYHVTCAAFPGWVHQAEKEQLRRSPISHAPCTSCCVLKMCRPVMVWDFDNRSRYIDFHGAALIAADIDSHVVQVALDPTALRSGPFCPVCLQLSQRRWQVLRVCGNATAEPSGIGQQGQVFTRWAFPRRGWCEPDAPGRSLFICLISDCGNGCKQSAQLGRGSTCGMLGTQTLRRLLQMSQCTLQTTWAQRCQLERLSIIGGVFTLHPCWHNIGGTLEDAGQRVLAFLVFGVPSWRLGGGPSLWQPLQQQCEKFCSVQRRSLSTQTFSAFTREDSCCNASQTSMTSAARGLQ